MHQTVEFLVIVKFLEAIKDMTPDPWSIQDLLFDMVKMITLLCSEWAGLRGCGYVRHRGFGIAPRTPSRCMDVGRKDFRRFWFVGKFWLNKNEVPRDI